MQPPQALRIYEFGDFELDALRRVLVSRVSGQPVDITGRVMDALLYLVERPGELIEKKALMDALWPHVVVEDGNLTQTIHTLRRVLGEKAGEHRYIATVPGRGYRFVAGVSRQTDAPAGAPFPMEVSVTMEVPTPPRPPGLFWWGTAAAVVLSMAGLLSWLGKKPAPVAAIPVPVVAFSSSIAVLPFVDMSTAQDQAHFAEGLSEEILNLLAQGEDLRVIARTSSFSFKDQNADIHTIAERLGVTHVLEGSVRKTNDRVRISAQLIDGATSAHVWSNTFDRDVTDIFGVQREIAASVADALHVKFRHASATRAETDSPQAYDHYLQGRHLFNRRSGPDLLQAKSRFEQALRLDPDYGRAWAALAGVYRVAHFESLDLPDAARQWRNAAERAVEVAPDLAEAQMRFAQYQWYTGDDAAARAAIARAAALDPQEPLLIGMSVSGAISRGRLDEAVALQRKVVAIDPLSAANRGNLGIYLMMMGEYADAQAELERSLELSPAAALTLASIADVLILQRRAEEALVVAARMPEGHLRDERLAIAHFTHGQAREGEAALQRLIDRASQEKAEVDVAVAVANVYAARNDVDRAFTWLGTARQRAEDRDGALMGQGALFDGMQVAPFLKPLHADPRWAALRPRGGFGQ
jgi:TolB-like protein/DNA-binding winged helix-turn-helix (wHTH) protein/tetratricopeptide (TPR) repeat protein